MIVIHAGRRRELSGGFRKTTNNRMEILAAVEGLKAVGRDHGSRVTVYSDSRYLVDMVNGGHARKWRTNGWTLASRKPALNVDLWTELLELADSGDISFEWVRGHNEHPENERCDEMAVEARQVEDLPADVGYEGQSTPIAPVQLSLFD